MATHFFGDTAVLTGRTLRHVTRSLDTVITTAVTPVAIMALFVYVLGGAIEVGPVSYVNYMLPGILLITIASGISYTALRLFTDLQSGIFERFRSMPIARPGVLWAHVLTYNLIRTIIAQAASKHGLEPRSISFKGAVQTLEAFQPALALLGEHDLEFRRAL